MNIIINQSKLLSAIHTVEHIVSKNVSLPILTTILIKTENGHIVLTATNLEIGIYCRLGAKIEREGVIAVPARVFSDFISSIKDEKINLIVEKQVLFISSEHYKTQILCMKADEFPIIPVLKNIEELSFSSEILKKALGSVVDATALIETRPELSGVYIHTTEKEVIFAATDSFRLSEYICDLPGHDGKQFIIPRSTVLEVMKLVGGRNEEVKLGFSENQMVVRGSDFELVSRLIDGRYPDYKKVIPERFLTTISLTKSEFERSVRMASIFSSSIADLQLKATANSLELIAKNTDKGEIVSTMNISPNKTPFSVSLNYRYLLDGLKSIESETVNINFSGDGSPLVIRGEGDKQHLYIIMPLRS